MARKKTKVIRYRKPLNFNAGVIIFLVFGIYLLYNIGTWMTHQRVSIYEVGNVTTSSEDSSYTALILREETTYTTKNAGYVNYYIRESSRASVGTTVYSIDENGSYTTLINSGTAGDSTLTSEQLDLLENRLASYSAGYSSSQFSEVYNTKYAVQNLLLNYLSSGTLENLDSLGIDTTYLTTVAAEQAGIVEYSCDGMEDLQESELSTESFNTDNYAPTSVGAGTMLAQGDFVYKIIDSETWNIYLPLTDEDASDLASVSKVYLHFNDVNIDAAAQFSEITGTDGTVIGKCTLSRYMIQLADRRYTTITLLKSKSVSENKSGLKIPKTSVTSRECYVVPEGFAVLGGNSSTIGFIRRNASGDAEVIQPDIYAHQDGYYYISEDGIEEDTILLKPDSTGEEIDGVTVYAANIVTTTAAAEESEASGESSSSDSSEASASGSESSADASETSEAAGESASTEASSADASASSEDAVAAGSETTASGSGETGNDVSSEVSPEVSSEAAASGESAAASDSAASSEETAETQLEGESVSVPTNGDTYKVSATNNLQGCLCVNKGYCVFRMINILSDTGDYYIVESGTSYGLSVYDHILLNADTAEEGDILYQ